MSRFVVYTHRDADGRALYVGQSMRLAERTSEHRATKSWWQDIATIEVDHVHSKEEARLRERALIQALNPPGNRLLRLRAPKPGPPRPAAREQPSDEINHAAQLTGARALYERRVSELRERERARTAAIQAAHFEGGWTVRRIAATIDVSPALVGKLLKRR